MREIEIGASYYHCLSYIFFDIYHNHRTKFNLISKNGHQNIFPPVLLMRILKYINIKI